MTTGVDESDVKHLMSRSLLDIVNERDPGSRATAIRVPSYRSANSWSLPPDAA